MTVTELLAAILAAYPGANPDAIGAFKPVFLGRFQHREGDRLREAFEATIAEFRPNARQPFPIPADIEAHLPSVRDIKTDEAGPIRQALEQRKERADRLFAAWHSTQGLKIRAARPFAVFSACVIEVAERCRRNRVDGVGRVLLSPEDIASCELRAITSERVHRFGRLPSAEIDWQTQCDEIRADWTKARAA